MNTQSIFTLLQDKCHLFTSDLVAVGVSGGADSMCLLHLLKQGGYPIIALHFDHALRPESAADAEFLRKICDEWGIPLIVERQDVAAFSTEQHMSIEEAARILRYRFLFSKAEGSSASALVVAHHANDQVETVLMHFLRGAGMDGLRGMQTKSLLPQFSQIVPLVRPFLSIWKSELLDYCNQWKIEYIEDHTNLDTKYYRNWLRHHLIPEIEEKNPGFQGSLIRTAAVVTAQHELIEERIEEEWNSLDVVQGTGWLRIDLPHFLKINQGLQREIIRKIVLTLLPSIRDLDFNTIERVIEWISSGSVGKFLDVMAGIRSIVRGDWLYFAFSDTDIPVADYPQLRQEQLQIESTGTIRIDLDWSIFIEEAAYSPALMDYIKTSDAGDAFIDGDKVQFPLTIRKRKAGDRVTLLGLPQTRQKLSDLMINHKVPAYARENYPLVAIDGSIVWIPGIQICDDVKVTSQTRKILHLKLQRSSS